MEIKLSLPSQGLTDTAATEPAMQPARKERKKGALSSVKSRSALFKWANSGK